MPLPPYRSVLLPSGNRRMLLSRVTPRPAVRLMTSPSSFWAKAGIVRAAQRRPAPPSTVANGRKDLPSPFILLISFMTILSYKSRSGGKWAQRGEALGDTRSCKGGGL
jgi:hypothetical protein